MEGSRGVSLVFFSFDDLVLVSIEICASYPNNSNKKSVWHLSWTTYDTKLHALFPYATQLLGTEEEGMRLYV